MAVLKSAAFFVNGSHGGTRMGVREGRAPRRSIKSNAPEARY